MAAEPWKTDDWFSSPWNYLPEVTEGFQIPDRVEIHDVTLRDGEQQAGVEFNADEKVRIAEALSEAGIHRIEAGLPAVLGVDGLCGGVGEFGDAAQRELVWPLRAKDVFGGIEDGPVAGRGGCRLGGSGHGARIVRTML